MGLVNCINIGPMVDQEARDLCLPSRGCEHEGGSTCFGTRVNLDTRCEQFLKEVLAAPASCLAKRRGRTSVRSKFTDELFNGTAIVFFKTRDTHEHFHLGVVCFPSKSCIAPSISGN